MDDITEAENTLSGTPKHQSAAERMAPFVAEYSGIVSGDSEPGFTVLGDMLSDLFHYAAWQGYDAREVVSRAFTHFDAEQPHQDYHLERAVAVWLDENRDDPENHAYEGDMNTQTDPCKRCGDNGAGLLHAFDPRFGSDYFSEVILDAFESTKE